MFFEVERIDRILREMKGYIYPKSEILYSVFMKNGDFPDIKAVDESDIEWTVFNPDDRWGGKDKRSWFRIEVVIPQAFEGRPVVLEIKTGREGEWDAINPQFLIYLDGKIVQGLDVNHREIIISESARVGEKHVVDLHAYSGMMEGLVELKAQIAVLDRITEKVYYDIKVPLDVAKLMNKENIVRIDIINFLRNTINLMDFRKPHSEEYYSSLMGAEEYITEKFYNEYCGNNRVTAACVGHSHIDVAWLWTLKQTREKVARSFSTVLNLMKQYPEYTFIASQPQLYKFLKEEHKDLYEELKERVREGRWEADGGMWLEADCNLISGESLIRQILFGTRFFKDEFGVDNKILWLPDVFGYSAALPQILSKFGIEYFLTTKISWNEYNKLPYDTFMWEGIDGTAILSYFITTADYEKVIANSYRTVYEGFINPSQVMGAWERYQQKNINDEILISYGYGDGGGGPTKEMLENARRLEKGIPGCPTVKMTRAREFFERLKERVSENKMLPRWVGELYLEYHRGTYTTMGRNKRYNRKCEFLYQDVEMFNILNISTNKKASYPQHEVNEGWETILLNQFHDIIPGSSIKEVYDESKEQYEEVIEKGNKLLNDAIMDISCNINLNEMSLVVFNQLGFDRSDVVEIDGLYNMGDIELTDSSGAVYAAQQIENNRYIAYVEGIPAKGYKTFTIGSRKKPIDRKMIFSKNCLKNKYFDIVFDEDANITSIYDKVNNREVLKANTKANVLQAFEDKPYNFDAWDINIYYQEKMWEINDVEEISIVDNGPVRITVKVVKRFVDSIITQYIHVYNDIPRIDFENEIDWKEKQILLKATFPVDIHNDKATYEIQYGNIERPTHWNTSWDLARFEVCAHKWADLSEDDYGVSLLNDCKYGHDIKDGVMRLTLLKSPTWPNPDADREIHRFTYSLYPHSGNWKSGNTVQMAYSLNCPMYTRIEEPHDGYLPKDLCFVRGNQENVIVEVIKLEEDSDSMILRLYECYNRRSDVTLEFFKELEFVKETDLNENEIGDIAVKGSKIEFQIKPYEIKTFKFRYK